MITNSVGRFGYDDLYTIDASKIDTCLGWLQHKSFGTSLCKIVKWHLDNVTLYQCAQDNICWHLRLIEGNKETVA